MQPEGTARALPRGQDFGKGVSSDDTPINVHGEKSRCPGLEMEEKYCWFGKSDRDRIPTLCREWGGMDLENSRTNILFLVFISAL